MRSCWDVSRWSTDVNGFPEPDGSQRNRREVNVTPNDVKYIFNGPGAAKIFRTPFGSAGRGTERGPMFNQLNLGLFKNIKLWENVQLQLRGEAFKRPEPPAAGHRQCGNRWHEPPAQHQRQQRRRGRRGVW